MSARPREHLAAAEASLARLRDLNDAAESGEKTVLRAQVIAAATEAGIEAILAVASAAVEISNALTVINLSLRKQKNS